MSDFSIFFSFIRDHFFCQQYVFHPVAVGCSCCICRNFDDYNFPSNLSNTERVHAQEDIKKRYLSRLVKKYNQCIDVVSLPESMKSLFYNQYSSLYTPSMDDCSGRCIHWHHDLREWIWINADDHVQISAYVYGDKVRPLYRRLKAAEKLINGKNYARSDTFGYLTHDLHALGSGVQVTYTLHLPGLMYTKKISLLQSALLSLGVQLMPLLSGESGSFLFKLISLRTVGVSAADELLRLEQVVQVIINQEMLCRKQMETGDIVYDRVCRAYGLARYAPSLVHKESIELLSWLRLGIYYGHISDTISQTLDAAIVSGMLTACVSCTGTSDKDFTKFFKQLLNNIEI